MGFKLFEEKVGTCRAKHGETKRKLRTNECTKRASSQRTLSSLANSGTRAKLENQERNRQQLCQVSSLQCKSQSNTFFIYLKQKKNKEIRFSRFDFKADLLRKQLLVMSKNQQDLVNICNKEFKELALINHAQSSLVSYGDLNLSDLSQTHTSMEPEFNPMSSLYKHQQNIIEMQQEEIERLNRAYNELLAKHNDMAIELDTYKQNLKLKVSFNLFLIRE